MRKKLSAYFKNEDEALEAATKLKAANVKILSVEEVTEEADPRYPAFLSGMASLGGLHNTPPLGPNLFYPFESFEEEFATFDTHVPYWYGAGNDENKTYLVRFAVKRQDVDEAMRIINENRGKV